MGGEEVDILSVLFPPLHSYADWLRKEELLWKFKQG